MDTIRAWKDPDYRKSLDPSISPPHPSGTIELDDSALADVGGGSSIACGITVTLALCSPVGTFCGSCGMGTSGCC